MREVRQEIAVNMCIEEPDLYHWATAKDPSKIYIPIDKREKVEVLKSLMQIDKTVKRVLDYYLSKTIVITVNS